MKQLFFLSTELRLLAQGNRVLFSASFAHSRSGFDQ